MKSDVVENIDRISSLPDTILQHILSFIPTKDAIQTSILSTRWNNTWIGTPVVDINLVQTSVTAAYRQNFMTFMDKLLLLHDGYNIEKLCLSFRCYIDLAFVTSWISTLLTQHKVEDMDLGIDSWSKNLLLPSSLFTCESLKRLRIAKCSIVQIPNSFCMLNLKDLALHCTQFSCENLTQQVFFTFPNLECSSLSYCQWKNMKSVCISSPRLRRLEICDVSMGCDDCEVIIEAPSLISFKFTVDDQLVPKYSLRNLSSLVSADINLKGSAANGQYVIQFFRAISNVKNLTISLAAITALCEAENSLHQLTFLNVISLSVTGTHVLSYQKFLRFLPMLPNLESLSFPSGVGKILEEGDDEILAEPLPSFLWNTKAIEVRYFGGEHYEMFIIELFLKNAIVMERMTIRYSSRLSVTEKEQTTRRLLNLPRGSTCCVMDVQ